MADLIPFGIDQTTGQQKTLSSGDTLTDTSGSAFGGSLIFVEKKEITAATTTTTFSGLDGNTDGVYVLYADIVSGTTSTSVIEYFMNPNGVTTNQGSEEKILSGTYTQSQNSRMQIASNFGAPASNQSWSVITFWARATGPGGTALRRSYKSASQRGTTEFLYTGQWADTSTNITSLEIEADAANEIAPGTTLILYKLGSA